MTLTTWLLVVTVVLFLQKYSLTIIGKLVFIVICPIIIGVFGIGLLRRNKKLLLKSVNGFIIAALVFFTIPIGVNLSNEVKETYNFSLNNTLAEAENAKEKTDEVAGDGEDDDQNFIAGAISKVTDAVSSTVMGGLEAAEKYLNTLTESLAVLVVTSCIIPLCVMLVFVWIIKVLIGIDFGKVSLNICNHFKHSSNGDSE